MEALNMDVLNNIKPFSGTPEEMPGERLISEGKALQRVQTQYTTAVAVQKPRSIAKVTANVLEEAKLAGSAFYYRWEVMNRKTGKKSVVQGPSIDLAMAIARNYGNCAVDIEGTETPTHYMFKGVFIDLETGFTVPRLYRQRKNQAIGKFEDDRAEDVVFQIGQSKAQRNAITKAAPGWLVDQAIEEARQAEINKIKPENLHVARGKVLDFFASYGVTQERMEAKVGRKADIWTAEDIADLRGSATALKEGRIGPDELFPLEEVTIQAQGPAPAETSSSPEGEAKGTPMNPPPPSFPCPHCKFVAASDRGLKKHITQSHPLQSEGATKHFGTTSNDIKITGETVTEPPPAEPPQNTIEPEDPPEDPGSAEEAPLFPDPEVDDDKAFMTEAENYWDAILGHGKAGEVVWGKILGVFDGAKSHTEVKKIRRGSFLSTCRAQLEKLNAGK